LRKDPVRAPERAGSRGVGGIVVEAGSPIEDSLEGTHRGEDRVVEEVEAVSLGEHSLEREGFQEFTPSVGFYLQQKLVDFLVH
jgi:hypothetical protein